MFSLNRAKVFLQSMLLLSLLVYMDVWTVVSSSKVRSWDGLIGIRGEVKLDNFAVGRDGGFQRA